MLHIRKSNTCDMLPQNTKNYILISQLVCLVQRSLWDWYLYFLALLFPSPIWSRFQNVFGQETVILCWSKIFWVLVWIWRLLLGIVQLGCLGGEKNLWWQLLHIRLTSLWASLSKKFRDIPFGVFVLIGVSF